MQLDSDPIGMYVFGGVVLAGTAVAVIVDLLRKNNDRLWEIATELKFRNDAADVKIKDLVRANAEVVAYANARAEVQAQATIPAPAPAAVEAPVAEQVAEEPLPGGRINLTPAPEKLQITVAAEVESAAAASLEVPRLDRPNRKPHREMTPAVAAVANLVEARLGGGAARHAAPAVEVEAKQPVVEVELPQEVLAVAETAQLDPGATLKIPIPVLAEDVIPVLAEAVAVDFVPAAVEASAVDEPAIAADILAGDFAPVAADGPVVVEMPAEAETAVVEPQPSLANTVGFGELVSIF